MIPKELFVESINAIKQQMELNVKVSKHLGEAFPDAHTANLLPNTDTVVNALIKVLEFRDLF